MLRPPPRSQADRERGRCIRYRSSQTARRISFQPRLFQDTTLRLGIEVHGRVAGNGRASLLGWMFVLAMAAFDIDQGPTVPFNEIDGVPDLHTDIVGNGP